MPPFTIANRLFAVICFLVASCAILRGVRAQDDWLQFRGPGAQGVATSANVPDHWSESENVLWRIDVPGRGWSSPIVVDGKVYLTTVTRKEGEPESAKPGLYFGGNRNAPPDVPHSWRLVCLDLQDGRQLWSRTLHLGVPETPRHIKNSYASETPVSDGRGVYVLFGDVGLYALTLDGQLKWKHDLPPCKTRYDWGTAASPVIHRDRLYMVSDNEEDSYLAAFDTATGEQVWRTERDEKSNWSTPFIWQNRLRTEIVTPGTGKVRSYDLQGNLLYEFDGCSSITIATPYAAGELLIVSSGYILDQDRPIFAILPGGSGDISLTDDETSNQYIAWCRPQAAPYNPTTLAHDGLLYILYDRGFVQVLDAATGEQVHEKSRIPGGRSFTASPWVIGDRIFFLNEFGTTFVYQRGDAFRLLHKNELNDEEMYMASPAIADDKLLIRSSGRLICIAQP